MKITTRTALTSSVLSRIQSETAGYMRDVRAGAVADLAAAQAHLDAATTDAARAYAAETVAICKSALRSLR